MSKNDSIQFSANLGFLWTDLDLPKAIQEAKKAGFDAVECHMPYDFPANDVRQVLIDCDLPLVSLNTRIGKFGIEDLGVAAKPGREEEAREYIDEAIAYAVAVGCQNISVVAGRTGKTDAAELVYQQNLTYACNEASKYGKTILIEPLNENVAQDYHLLSIEHGMETIDAVGHANLKLMVDCFHTRTMQGPNLKQIFTSCVDYLGHVQISAFPDRGEPIGGDIDYRHLLPYLRDIGYKGYFGAEYTPRGDIYAGLSWLKHWNEAE